MILFSSAVYNVLLNRIHSESSKYSVQLPSNALLNADGNDVYFRFGGAVISDMLHLRYKQIRAIREILRRGAVYHNRYLS